MSKSKYNSSQRNTNSKWLTILGALSVFLWLLTLQGSSKVHGERAENLDIVAQEILEIQQQLGGSVVDKKFPPAKLPAVELPEQQFPKQQPGTPGLPSAASTPTPSASTWSFLAPSSDPARQTLPAPPQRVVVLRETSRQLDSAAYRLEILDLYEQADSLRELANRLRQQARLQREQQLSESD